VTSGRGLETLLSASNPKQFIAPIVFNPDGKAPTTVTLEPPAGKLDTVTLPIAFVPAGKSSATDYISGIQVTNTNLYTTTDATIPMPTQTFGYVAGILFLQSPTNNTDLTGNQTLTEVGSAAYSATGPSISIQPYTP
jgi:hypothetical protein